jgi:predicted nuclease with TOPRIM domain
MRIDLSRFVTDVQGNISALVDAARRAPELLDILRDTHRVLLKMEAVIDRLEGPLNELEEKFSSLNISPERLERLERAVLNIERATAGVEATMGALPRVLRSRIDRFRPQTASEESVPE